MNEVKHYDLNGYEKRIKGAAYVILVLIFSLLVSYLRERCLRVRQLSQINFLTNCKRRN